MHATRKLFLLKPELDRPRKGFFQKFAAVSVRLTGNPATFGLALTLVAVWAVTGPVFHFSDTWQLVINTATTIITFLMVFLIQNSQNRDSEAIQLKLDELIRATESAHNAFLDIEEISEPELDRLRANFEVLARKARRDLRSGKSDLGCPDGHCSEKNNNHEAHASTRHHSGRHRIEPVARARM